MSPSDPESAPAGVHRTLRNLHRTLKLAAFLLAVLVLQNGGTLGILVGGGATLLLAYDAFSDLFDGNR